MTDRGKLFTIECFGTKKGDNVILALYDGDRLIEVQYAPYDEKTIVFTTQKVYENAKVMVWNDKMKPYGKYEKIYVY